MLPETRNSYRRAGIAAFDYLVELMGGVKLSAVNGNSREDGENVH